MMNQLLTIPFRLPGLNEVTNANRRNRYAGAKLKKETEERILWCIKDAKLKPIQYPCIVHITFDEPNRRRDTDNVESAKKMVLDALVKAGVLQGDSPRYVIGSPSWTRYGVNGAQVLVTIIEDQREDWLRERLRRAAEVIKE
jgi:Holliday junction resolvase RusA-like endonuclease